MKLEYCKPEIIRLKDYYDEKWLQNRVEEDTSLLGLGDLITIERERKQPTGGRIDFLLFDPETQTMYETEVMLGALDESHIIRAIEYWDIERKRFPTRDHKAVIVAEEITSRFFNVIALINRAIPLIAFQLIATKWEDKIFLTFTKILDVYQEPEDEEDIPGEIVDRNYWVNRSNPRSMELMDEMIEIVRTLDQESRITYNKHHVALGTQRRNFCWFHPRKKEGLCYFEIRVGPDNFDIAKALFEEMGVTFTHRKEDLMAIPLRVKVFRDHKERFAEMIKEAWRAYR